MTNKDISKEIVDIAYKDIRKILEKACSTAYRAVNFEMVRAYWQIGNVIVEEEQKGNERAKYGENLISGLSIKLMNEFGKGFNQTNLKYIRQFYLKFPNSHALRAELTWTHYRLLLRIEKEEARQFYMAESVNSNWSTRELERQINSLLYEKIALSKNKEKIKELSQKGQIIKKPEDLVKDPYVLEFLGLKDNTKFNPIEFDGFRKQVGINSFTLTIGEMIKKINKIKQKKLEYKRTRKANNFFTLQANCFMQRQMLCKNKQVSGR